MPDASTNPDLSLLARFREPPEHSLPQFGVVCSHRNRETQTHLRKKVKLVWEPIPPFMQAATCSEAVLRQ